MAIVPARAVICRLLLRELALNCTTPDGKQGCSIDSFKQVDQATFCATKFRFFFQKMVDFHKVRFKISSVNIFLYEAALP